LQDVEMTAFISAMFAYGNVAAMKKFLEQLFYEFGSSPVFNLLHKKVKGSNLYYRFQNSDDVKTLIYALREIYICTMSEDRTFEGIILQDDLGGGELKRGQDHAASLHKKSAEFYGVLNSFSARGNNHLADRIDRLRSALLDSVPMQKQTQGYRHLIGAGSEQSARKRYCMFFRWMTRKGFPDFHIYRNQKSSELVIPLDTHIMKVSQKLGLRTRNTPNWTTAIEITENLKKIDPEDPLKYDFALTRPGILREIFPV